MLCLRYHLHKLLPGLVVALATGQIRFCWSVPGICWTYQTPGFYDQLTLPGIYPAWADSGYIQCRAASVWSIAIWSSLAKTDFSNWNSSFCSKLYLILIYFIYGLIYVIVWLQTWHFGQYKRFSNGYRGQNSQNINLHLFGKWSCGVYLWGGTRFWWSLSYEPYVYPLKLLFKFISN